MWILPTFNRPDLLKRTLKHCRDNGTSTKGLILVNGGDHEDYEWLDRHSCNGWAVEFLPSNLGVAGAMQYAFKHYPDEPWYGWFADDLVPRTLGWDTKMVSALKPGGMVSAENNWHKPPRFQTGIVDGGLAREVGFLHLPGSWACFSDNFWERLGTELGTWQFLEDVVVETLNPRKGDYKWDDATELSYNKKTFRKDAAIWREFGKEPYIEVRERVRERFGVGAARKVTLTGNSVAICTPAVDGKLTTRYAASLTESITLMQKLGIGYGLFMLDKCSILPYARNRLVADFLKTSATHMLFVDADMGWPENAIPELLAHDKDVIAAVGITKDEDPDKRHFCVGLDPDVTEFDPTRGIMRVMQVGTGFMLIKRHVLEAMWAKYDEKATGTPQDAPHLGPIHWIFDYDIGCPDGWGEDYTFCRRWRDMGGDVWIDPSIRLEHVGDYSYTGTYLDWLQEKHGREQAA